MKHIKRIIGFIRMKYMQFLIREIDRYDLGFIWKYDTQKEIDEDMGCIPIVGIPFYDEKPRGD